MQLELLRSQAPDALQLSFGLLRSQVDMEPALGQYLPNVFERYHLLLRPIHRSPSDEGWLTASVAASPDEEILLDRTSPHHVGYRPTISGTLGAA